MPKPTIYFERSEKQGSSERSEEGSYLINQRNNSIIKTFRGSSMVERHAVNVMVVGSNPTRGADFNRLIGDFLVE